jgi:hypothetical protein
MSVIRAVATMLVLALALSVLFKISSPPSAAQVQAAQVVANRPVGPIAADSLPAGSAVVSVPKGVPAVAERLASPNTAKLASHTASTVHQQEPRHTVATSMPAVPIAGARPPKAQQVARSAPLQPPATHSEQERAVESNPPLHPKVSHLSLLPRTVSNASSPGERKSSASVAGGRKSTLARTSQFPTQRDRYAPSLSDRNVSRPNTMPPEDRKSQSRYIPSRGASLYDTPRHDRSSQPRTGSHQTMSHDGDRQSLNSDRDTARFSSRIQLSDKKRRALLREYEKTARRQLEIRRELGRSVLTRPSRNERYSDASGYRE